MPHLTVSEYLRSLHGGQASLEAPVLLWAAPRPSQIPRPTEHRNVLRRWQPTMKELPLLEPKPEPPGPALVLPVVKSALPNPLTMGVTIGRLDSNDLVIDDRSISRFHGWLAHDAAKGWAFVDANSVFGTWVDGVPVQPTARTPLIDGSTLRLGGVDLQFLLAPSLIARFS